MSRAKQISRNAPKRKRDEDEHTSPKVTKKITTSPSPLEDADERDNATITVAKDAQLSSKIKDVNNAIGYMDNSLLADHFAQQ